MTLDDSAAAAARDFAKALGKRIAEQLGHDLIGVYLLGSLAHGGFSRRYSDIDVGVITEQGLTPAARDWIQGEATRISSELAPKLSIFWADRSFTLGRFPPLDRIDFLDHAVALTECERLAPSRPTLEEIRTYLLGRPYESWSQAASEFAGSAVLDAKDHKSYVRVLLYPARFVLSFMTGKMASNDHAVDYLDGHAPPGLDVDLVRRALKCRRAASDPDHLFSDRILLPRQVAACAAFIAESAAESP